MIFEKKWDLKANIDKEEFLNENYEYLYKKLIFNPLFKIVILTILSKREKDSAKVFSIVTK